MAAAIQVVGPSGTLEVFGVKLVGVSADSGKKLLFSAALIVALLVLRKLLRAAARVLSGRHERIRLWTTQAISVLLAAALVIGTASIWFERPERLATAIGMVTAGLAFALQRVVTALAGYLVILRGRTFTVGDRITMGGVRGDVIRLGFIQTTIMEMGQPATVEAQADPAMWVRSRQYTGRVVTVTNDKLFDEPVYNYTSEFPYIWEEILLPIPYSADRDRAEQILLAAAQRHTMDARALSGDVLQELERRFAIKPPEIGPRVYYRLTDNWLEMALRLIVPDHGIRDIKDAISREVLREFDRAGITIASATLEVTTRPLAAP
ncbi:MAG: mechanosensitive ion channel family protein [Polyangia bacterium]